MSSRYLWQVACVALLSMVGCASVPNKYQASKIPPSLRAPSLANIQTLDLTKLASSTVSSDLIVAGDVLEISISSGLNTKEESTFPTRVNDQGSANIPIVGDIRLAGLELEEAEAEISTACINRELYRAPHVTVTMKRPKVNRVTVLGAVEEPATYELRSGASDILQALVAAGGPSENAGTILQVRHPGYSQGDENIPNLIAALGPAAEVIDDASNPQTANSGNGISLASHEIPVHTSGPQTVQVNLASAARTNLANVQIPDGTIIRLEKRDPKPVHVLGLVERPGRYDYPISEDLKLLDAVALASGTDNVFADKVYVIRQLPDQNEPSLIVCSLNNAKRNGDEDIRLAPGDIVSVEQTPQTAFFEVIKLIGFGVSGSLF